MNFLIFFFISNIITIVNCINLIPFEEYEKEISHDDISVFRNDINHDEIQNLTLEPKFYNNVIIKRSSSFNNKYYFESGNFEYETLKNHSFSNCVNEAVRQATNYGVIAVINFKHYITSKNTIKCYGIFLHAK